MNISVNISRITSLSCSLIGLPLNALAVFNDSSKSSSNLVEFLLSVFPKSSKALIPLTICLGGWLLAKDKKKAFIQRAFCFGSTISVAGIIGYENK